MRFVDHFYEELRAALLKCASFAEGDSSDTVIRESLMYSIWSHQRLRVNSLQTISGERIKILHPGFRNLEAGPDFKNALVSIGDAPMRQCDVELDISPICWHQHGHEGNPAYQNVGLQVVWHLSHSEPGTDRQILNLQTYLDAPVEELLKWGLSEDAQELPASVSGECAECFAQLSEEELDSLLRQAALVRLRCKAYDITASARIHGWERTLYIYLMRGLGYKQNSWPMQELAVAVLPQATSLLEMQAILLGVAGMIPRELPGDSSRNEYVLRLWETWWREQSRWCDHVLPGKMWRFDSIRPVNHPQRRVALAAHWFCNPGFVSAVENWGIRGLSQKDAAETLCKILLPTEPDEFWEHYYTLRSKPTRVPQALLGKERISDLFLNAIAPWFWARLEESPDLRVRKQFIEYYLNWPASGDNSRIRHALNRLYGAAPPPRFKHAFQQQGVLQITSDFCSRTTPCCHHCPLPLGLQRVTALG